MTQDVCFSNAMAVSIPQMLALLTFMFQRSPQFSASQSWYFSFLSVYRLTSAPVPPLRFSRNLMEEDNIQREEPQEDEVGDLQHLGENSWYTLHSQRFSVSIYEYLLSTIPME